MFKCPKCNNVLDKINCPKCGYTIPYYNGLYNFTDDKNLDIINEKKYIGYDEINLDFDPTLIYWKDRFSHNFGVYGESAKKLVSEVGIDKVFLDLGCGLGTATIPLAQEGVKVIGADISEVMLSIANKRLLQSYDNLYFCKMNAYDLMIADNSVDVVIENAMIHLVNDPKKVYEEIKRCLKPNGILVRFSTIGVPVSEEQAKISKITYDAYRDISNFYHDKLKKYGYESMELNNNSFEIEKSYFTKSETIKTDYMEEFNEFMKFRIHRLEHKAHSNLQHVPDKIHEEVFASTNAYAISKYGKDYKEMKNYSKYIASYDIYKLI